MTSVEGRRTLLSRAYARRDRAELDLFELHARRRAVVRRLTQDFGEDLGLRERGLGPGAALAMSLHRLLGDLSVAWIRQRKRIHRLNRLIGRLSVELADDGEPEGGP